MLKFFIFSFALLGFASSAVAQKETYYPSALKSKPITQGKIAFVFKQMDVAADGAFKQFKAHILFNPATPQHTQADIRLTIASVDTQNDQANAMLKSPLWFDAARYPQAQFTSTQVSALGQNKYKAKGFLTIKGIKRPVDTVFSFNSTNRQLTGQFAIKRVDYKVGEGEWADEDFINHEVVIRYQFVLPP